MDLKVQQHETRSTSERFPLTRVLNSDGTVLATLDVQSTAFGFPSLPSAIISDFLLIATTVYTIDKLIDRATAPDGWTRAINVTVPVSSPAKWRKARIELEACVS